MFGREGTKGERVWEVEKEVRGVLWWLYVLLGLSLHTCICMYVCIGF